eukprot:1430052-Lingulodinium_polyedra.AAC.1
MSSKAHVGRLEQATAPVEALQKERPTDPIPPPEELHPYDGRGIPSDLTALCDARHLAVRKFNDGSGVRQKF